MAQARLCKSVENDSVQKMMGRSTMEKHPRDCIGRVYKDDSVFGDAETATEKGFTDPIESFNTHMLRDFAMITICAVQSST